jgi:hypothetical protein
MDGFDLDPTNFASASLACGAIAIDPADPDRVYVGTGEGDTHRMFDSRVVNALPAYRGIGPIRTDDGGDTWLTEPTGAGSPTLAGGAFFALAVDPGDRENVLAATRGLQRVPRRAAHEWVGGGAKCIRASSRPRRGIHWFSPPNGEKASSSSDGTTWAARDGISDGERRADRSRRAAQSCKSCLCVCRREDGALLGLPLESIGGAGA